MFSLNVSLCVTIYHKLYFLLKIVLSYLIMFVVEIVANVQIKIEGQRRYDNFNTMTLIITISSHEPAVITSKEKTKQY